MAEKQSKTFSGMTSMLVDETGKMLKAVGEMLLPAAKYAAGKLTTIFANMNVSLKKFLLTDEIAAAAKEAARAMGIAAASTKPCQIAWL